MKKLNLRLTALALLPWLAYLPAAHAATATTDFNVTAHVPTSCSISTLPAELAFGDYAGADIPATTAFGVTCTSGGAYTIGLSDGNNPVAPGGQRRMRIGATANYLNYELYKELAHSNRWGDSDPSWVEDTGTGLEIDYTVYGLLPGSQSLIAGNYTDTITITVTYTP